MRFEVITIFPGMIGAAFGLTPADEGYEELRVQWFDHYQGAMAVHSTLFGGVVELLDGIAGAGMAGATLALCP